MTVTAQVIGAALSPLIQAVQGDINREFDRATPVFQTRAGALTYLKPNFTRLNEIAASLSGAGLVCSKEHADLLADVNATIFIADNPRLAFMRAVEKFFSRPAPLPGVHPRAFVDESARIDPTASIGANCYVGAECEIGPRSILYPNVTLLERVRLGAGVIIASGTVVGADGFGYERNEEMELEKFPHIGGVVIEDNVEVGSNTSIDRGTLGDTVIRSGARIDNQCHISHNVDIGRHAAVIAQSMIGGSVIVGDYCWLAPASIVMNQAKIGTRATVGLGSVVVKDVLPGLTVMGSPAIPADDFRVQRAALKKLLG